jgi:hypothetical protein
MRKRESSGNRRISDRNGRMGGEGSVNRVTELRGRRGGGVERRTRQAKRERRADNF